MTSTTTDRPRSVSPDPTPEQWASQQALDELRLAPSMAPGIVRRHTLEECAAVLTGLARRDNDLLVELTTGVDPLSVAQAVECMQEMRAPWLHPASALDVDAWFALREAVQIADAHQTGDYEWRLNGWTSADAAERGLGYAVADALWPLLNGPAARRCRDCYGLPVWEQREGKPTSDPGPRWRNNPNAPVVPLCPAHGGSA